MPFRSEAQKRFLERELPEIARKFVADTKADAPPLPERAPVRRPSKPRESVAAVAARLVNKRA